MCGFNMDNFDKRKKMEPEEIDISNGALFLMITDLKREIQSLKKELKELKPMIHQSYGRTMRIGGSNG